MAWEVGAGRGAGEADKDGRSWCTHGKHEVSLDTCARAGAQECPEDIQMHPGEKQVPTARDLNWFASDRCRAGSTILHGRCDVIHVSLYGPPCLCLEIVHCFRLGLASAFRGAIFGSIFRSIHCRELSREMRPAVFPVFEWFV